MAIDPSRFETITPSQFITFTLPNPLPITPHSSLHTPLLRISVLDSPSPDKHPPSVAALVVPPHQESDWTFSTHSGHLQLLLNNFHHISRLILVGNNLDNNNNNNNNKINKNKNKNKKYDDKEEIESGLKDIVTALHPKACFRNGLPGVVYVTYEDGVVSRVVLERFIGPYVGEFLVEDVELESREMRRRLRFKRMPNLIQSQVRVVGSFVNGGGCDMELGLMGLMGLRGRKGVVFRVDVGTLVQPYLSPMVAAVFLIASRINERVRGGVKPRALCLGVGGGALLSFLNSQLGFEVVGVEADEIVLRVAREYFGLVDGKDIRVVVGDAMKLGETGSRDGNDLHVKIDGLDSKFDVVMVDLDSNEAKSGISAPPLEFVKRSVFEAMRSLLLNHGVLVMNVIPPDELFYETLVQELKDVFHSVYELDVKNDGNIVLMATVSPVECNDQDGVFLKRLRAVVSGSYMETIVEL